MMPLEPPDTWYVSGAVGWLELGNAAEARSELARVSPAQRQHPDALEVQWLICAEQQEWVEGLEAARSLIHSVPERVSGWLHQSYALRRIDGGGVQQAWDALLPTYSKFPKEPIVPYNLACYACQLGQLDTARVWLKKAFAMESAGPLKQQAMEDKDLEPLWSELGNL